MSRCEDLRPELEAYLDGSADAAAVAAVEAHLLTCAACRGEVADVKQVVSAAHTLGPIDPPEHLWLEIAGQLRPGTSEPPVRVARRAPRAVWQWAGLAAALLAITTAVYFVSGNGGTPPAATSTEAARQAPAGTVEAVNEELDRAVEHYERAIGELQALAAKGSTAIEPTVAAALDAEGQAIDRAIAESRTAVTTNPDSESARVSLFDALRRKVNVLQATVALITEMNQGDAAGASRAAENLGREL
jgi:anti-sigma factor RsiW